MTVDNIKTLWSSAIEDLLQGKISDNAISNLSKQTKDSIRRIKIYDNYRERANLAVEQNRPFDSTNNPLVLAQRADLSIQNRIWVIYLATYFGKSETSSWDLFNRASFDKNKTFIKIEMIRANTQKYFEYLQSFDFFETTKFSNHRKYTKKALVGNKGFFRSMNYVLENLESFIQEQEFEFDEMFLLSKRIPNFGRLAAFDFSSSLVKCGLNVKEPLSMYARNSTGPLRALGLLLRLTDSVDTDNTRKELSDDLVRWFNEHSNIFMAGQVLEDAICNWQKNPNTYTLYKG